MNEKERRIREGLKRIATDHIPVILFDGEVIAVDGENYFCDVQLDTEENAVITDVRLRAASIGNQSVDILPAIGSEVVIAKLDGDEYLVLAIDEITSYRVTVGTNVLTITDTGFELSNGSTSLKDILSELVNQMLAIYAPKNIAGINNIQILIDNLLQ